MSKTLVIASLLHLMVNTTFAQDSVDHSLFDALLVEYVNEAGEVNYGALKEAEASEKVLSAYIDVLEATDPAMLEGAEAIAFWLNAYNAYTLKLIIDHYPVGSIREITPLRIKGLSLAIPKINSPFEYNLATINGKKYSLDDIEHVILRKQFNEPRIHFALVCASYSCPPLRREAFVASRLNEQLTDQAKRFLHDSTKNRVDTEKGVIYLSKIFKWFKKDFKQDGKSVQQYIAQFFDGDVAEEMAKNQYRVKHLKYDWSLNSNK